MAIVKWLDGAIVYLLNKKIMANIIAVQTLMGRDDFRSNYLQAYRSEKFEV